jgi:hypothetical protein
MRMPIRSTLVTALLVSGCTDTYRIPPAQLQYLNGYDIHSEESVGPGATFTPLPYRLISTDGQPVDYNSSTQLRLLGPGAKQLAPSGPFESILIEDNSFKAVPLTGQPYQLPLQEIQSVEIVEPNPQKTSQLIAFVSLLTTLILTGITIATTH